MRRTHRRTSARLLVLYVLLLCMPSTAGADLGLAAKCCAMEARVRSELLMPMNGYLAIVALDACFMPQPEPLKRFSVSTAAKLLILVRAAARHCDQMRCACAR